MGSAIADMMRNYQQQIKAYEAELLEVVNQKTHKAVDIDAMVEFSAYQKSKIESLFRESVMEFYNSYSPSLYSRRGSLYDVIKINEADENGAVAYNSAYDLYDTNAVVGRDGVDLFNRIFMEGYHGGGGNPPRYRVPVGSWWRWGRHAIRTESPDQIFSDKLLQAESGEIYETFKRISNKYNDRAIKEAYDLVPAIQRKHFG